MATITRYVDPDATGAGDGTSWTDAYTALATWESSENQDLTAPSSDIMECWVRASSGTADTTAVTITGWSTGSSAYIQIAATSTDEADADGWDASKYRLVVSDGRCFIAQEDYIRFISLQLERTYTASSFQEALLCSFQGASNEIRIDSCRLRTTNGTNTCINVSDADVVMKVYNTIIEYSSRDGITFGGSVLDMFNCTVYNCGDDGIAGTAGTVVIKNCAVFVTADDFDGTGAGSFTVDYCASDDGDGTNDVAESGGGANWPDDFVDAANGDFTLKSGSGLVGNGTDDPGSGLYSDDINGDARTSTWDVGADEFIAAVSGNPWYQYAQEQ